VGPFAFLVVEHRGADVLNRELQADYRLRIRATTRRNKKGNSGGLEAFATVCLRITDENDNGPMFRRLNYTLHVDTSVRLVE
jgi:hypothetical protein